MDRVRAYALLAAELERLRSLPRPEVVARLDKPAEIIAAVIGDAVVSLEVRVNWADTRQTKLQVTATAFGPSHWKMERLEEAIILELLDPAAPRPPIGKQV